MTSQARCSNPVLRTLADTPNAKRQRQRLKAAAAEASQKDCILGPRRPDVRRGPEAATAATNPKSLSRGRNSVPAEATEGPAGASWSSALKAITPTEETSRRHLRYEICSGSPFGAPGDPACSGSANPSQTPIASQTLIREQAPIRRSFQRLLEAAVEAPKSCRGCQASGELSQGRPESGGAVVAAVI